jgi:hypothetical protein
MSKQTIKEYLPAILFLAFVALYFGYSESRTSGFELLYYELFIRDREPISEPDRLSDYPEDKTYYFQFDPKTILASLDQSKDAFLPISYDDFIDINGKDASYTGIEWTQSDFLRVVNILSQRVWNEPLDLDDWDIYSIDFHGHCNDNFVGFGWLDFIYYKTIKIGWEPVYNARYIRLDLQSGLAWMGDNDFSRDIFLGYWENIELTTFRTTAEQAVQIAEEYRKNTAKANDKDCGLLIKGNNHSWDVYYDWPTSLKVFIDPFTGEIHSTK